jgi:hypothetical protein
MMSVRATERLVGDTVIATGLPNSPLMIVQSIDEETKIITTTWFSDTMEYQEGYFPASALDRAESSKAAKEKKAPAKSGKKTR